MCLTACGEPPTAADSFKADFSVSRDGIAYSGALTLTDSGLSVTMTAPYTVEGMRFDYTSDGLSISRGGLSAKANPDYISANAIPSVLHNTLTYLSQAAYTGSGNGEDSFTLPTPYGEAVITASNGAPISLTDPYSGLEITFDNVTIIGQDTADDDGS